MSPLPWRVVDAKVGRVVDADGNRVKLLEHLEYMVSLVNAANVRRVVAEPVRRKL